jgi:transposase-like protein
VANQRIHGTTHRHVFTSWQQEKPCLLPLLGRAAYPYASEETRRGSRDAFVSFKGNRYSVPWQRCQFHLQQNAQAYLPKQEMKAVVAADIRNVFNAPDRAAAEGLLTQVVARYQQNAPRLAAWMEANLPEGLSVFALPEAHRRLLRTSNALERVNKEVKRRTRVATLFPSEASCLRLVCAVLMEISDEWEAGKAYLTFKETD